MKAILLLTGLSLCFFVVQCGDVDSKQVVKVSNTQFSGVSDRTLDESLLSQLRKNRVERFGRWNVGEDSPLNYLVVGEAAGERLLVIDDAGNLLFKKDASDFRRVYEVWALRLDSPELLVEYNEGGQDSFVELLQYQEQRITNIVDTTKNENSFASGVSVEPQFRSAVNPSKEPFELRLTEFSLPSSGGKHTKVFRYTRGKYRLEGEFDRTKAADYRENLMVRR